MAATVRISSRGRDLLGKLASETGSTMTDVLEVALETYRRQRILDQANQAYAVLAEDAGAYGAYRGEMSALDATLDDGLRKYPA